MDWNWDTAVTFISTYQGYGYAAAVGYAGALIVPVDELAVGAFRLAVKFPLIRAAIRKNPAAVKKAIDSIEQALSHEVDAVAAEGNVNVRVTPAGVEKTAP